MSKNQLITQELLSQFKINTSAEGYWWDGEELWYRGYPMVSRSTENEKRLIAYLETAQAEDGRYGTREEYVAQYGEEAALALEGQWQDPYLCDDDDESVDQAEGGR